MKKNTQVGRWLNLAVFGANDGIITTFAVVAGVAGAKLSPSIVLVLGMANIAADGLSMTLGNYLGEKSENRLSELGRQKIKHLNVIKNSGVIFLSFMIAGLIPLLPYFFSLFGMNFGVLSQLQVSVFATLLGLFIVGSMRTFLTKGSWWKNGFEVLAVGSIAAVVAYFTGAFIETLVS